MSAEAPTPTPAWGTIPGGEARACPACGGTGRLPDGAAFLYMVSLRGGGAPVLHESALDPLKVDRAMSDARRDDRAFTWTDGFTLAREVADVRQVDADDLAAAAGKAEEGAGRG